MRTAWIETFDCDLTDEQKQLCEWIAQQAQAGAERIYYSSARAALGIQSDKELTCMLRNMRERLDQIHDMIQSPIVQTTVPYFDIHVDANHIWGRYLQAEEQATYSEPDVLNMPPEAVHC